MLEVAIPPLLARRGWHGILLEQHEIAGARLWSVTVKTGFGRAPKRRWFEGRPAALVFAADEAERCELLVFDLGGAGDD